MKNLTIEQRAMNYVSSKEGQTKITICACKASGKTVFMVYDENGMKKLINESSNALVFKEDGIRWAGRMINKIDKHYELGRVTVSTAWNKFEVGSNGFMSDAQEKVILDALNAGGEWFHHSNDVDNTIDALKRLVWEWTGHNHRRGVHDLHAVGANGHEYWIEVKGVHGRLFYS